MPPRPLFPTPQRRAPRRAAGWLSAVLLAALAAPALAGTASLHGSFTHDDELAQFTLDLPAEDVLSVRSWSYSGGINAAGQAIAGGGFAPVLALFDAAGWLVQTAHGSGTESACRLPGSAAPARSFCWDVAFSAPLDAGRYTLVLSQDGNDPPPGNLADGYSRAGVPDYTGQDFLGQPDQRFIQVDGAQRSGAWALDITASAVPEPAGALLMLLGLAGLVGQRLARRQPTQEAIG